MKLLSLVILLLFSLNTGAQDFDLSYRWGIAATVGWQKTILGGKFDDRADGDSMHSLQGRYQFDAVKSILFGYTRYDWDNSPTAARVYDASLLFRTSPYKKLSPVLGFGIGGVDIANYNVDENIKFGARAKAGLEYGFSPDIFLTMSLDFQYVGKMVGESRDLVIGEMFILAPQIGFTYFLPK